MKFRKQYYILMLVCWWQQADPFPLAPTNFFRPYDVNFRTELWPSGEDGFKRFKISSFVEYGDSTHGRNDDGDRVDLFSLYHSSESGLAMLKGAEPGTPIETLLIKVQSIPGGLIDDGRRGHFKVHGKYEELAVNLFGQVSTKIPSIDGVFDFSVYLPLRKRKAKNVRLTDLTGDKLPADLGIKENLTDDFEAIIKDLGDGLHFSDVDKKGVGDLVMMIGWHADYPQFRHFIKNVRLAFRLGLSLPTGAVSDENNPLSLPLGNDGAVGIPATLGIDLLMKNRFKAGLEFELLKLFDDTRVRRVKTAKEQTDLLLLTKAFTRKKFGPTWKFNLYLQGAHMWRGLSAKVAYQYVRHDDDKLFAKTNRFNNHIMNTAESLQDWTFHNLIFQLNYDFFKDFKRFAIKPQLSLFYKLPVFQGRRVIEAHTFGGQLVFNF